MNVSTDKLTGTALDWAVIAANGWLDDFAKYGFGLGDSDCYYSPSTSWSQAGPIIEREDIASLLKTNGGDWIAQGAYDRAADREALRYYGPTPLIAAMRCYVAGKLGPTVDVPEEFKRTINPRRTP